MSNLIGQHLGEYEIVERLGSSHMSTIYRAHQPSLSRDVKIKVLVPRANDLTKLRDQYKREGGRVVALDHPRIAKAFNFGEQGDCIYLVTEIVKGTCLIDVILKQPLTVEKTSSILDEVASALDYARTLGIEHHDLNAKHIWLDEKDQAYLTDTDFADTVYISSTTMPITPEIMGSPAYMSPERVLGKPADARSDVYVLGIITFEALTGKRPIDGTQPMDIMRKHLSEPAPSIRTLRPEISPAIDVIIGKSLAKAPEARFATSGEFATAFKAAR